MGKNISVLRGKSKIKYLKVQHLYWLQSYILDLKGKRFNSTIYVRRCGDHRKECSLINYYAKCGWDTRTCPHEFHVDVKNEMS